jgi:hypothetical protein
LLLSIVAHHKKRAIAVSREASALLAAAEALSPAVAAAIDECNTRLASAQAQLTATIRLANPGHESANLVLLGRLLSRSGYAVAMQSPTDADPGALVYPRIAKHF